MEEIRENYVELFECSLDLIFITNLNGKILDFNDVIIEKLGYSREELLNLYIRDFINKEQRRIAYNAINEINDKKKFTDVHKYKVKKKDGSFLYIEVQAIGLSENGKIIRFLNIGHDITNIQVTKQKLEESEQKYRYLFEESPYSIFLVNMNGLIEDCNKTTEKLFGFKREEVIGKNHRKLGIHPKDKLKLFNERFKILVLGGNVEPIEVQLSNKEGKLSWYQIQSSLIKIGKKDFIQSIYNDIDSKKKAEEKLRESEEKFRTIADQSLVGIGILQDNKAKYVNQKVADTFGYEIQEILNWPAGGFSTIIHPEYIEMELNNVNTVISSSNETSMQFQAKGIKKSGEIFWAEVFIKKIYYEGRPAMLGIFIDNTEKKLAEQKLLKSEEKFRNLSSELETILDIIPGLIYCKNTNDIITRINRTFADLLHLKKEDIIGKTTFDLFPKDQARAFRKDDLEVINSGKPKLNIEESANFPERKVYAITSKIPYFNERGDIIGIIGLSIDITERKKIEQKLKESEEKFRLMAEQSLVGIGILQDNRVKYVNETIANILENTVEEILNLPPGEFIIFIDPQYRDMELSLVTSFLSDPNEITARFQARALKKSKKEVWLEVFLKRIEYEGKPAIMGILIDITEMKMAEEKLIESESKYRQAYDRANFYKDLFAHDINNILQNILMSTEISYLNLKSSESLKNIKEMLDTISDQVKRGSNLVNNVRKLTELEEFKPELIIINAIENLIESIEFVKKSYPHKNIDFQLDLENKVFFIKANELIRAIYDNLLFNAVKHNNNPIIQIQIRAFEEIINNIQNLRIEFIDNGIGIQDSRKNIVFERRYNREKDTSGIGLGLSLVKKIIETYNGRIWVENRIFKDYTKGSKFILLIPKCLEIDD